jgi:thiamine transport system ATP-binding protein
MVTHDPADARHAADRVVFVDGGVADPPRPTDEVFAAPSPRLAAYLGTRR